MPIFNSPPSTFNFDRTPIVTVDPYHYSPEADELADAEAALQRARIELELTRTEIEQHHAIEEETASGV